MQAQAWETEWLATVGWNLARKDKEEARESTEPSSAGSFLTLVYPLVLGLFPFPFSVAQLFILAFTLVRS